MEFDTQLLLCLLVESSWIELTNILFAYLNIGKPKLKAILLYIINIAILCLIYIFIDENIAELWNIISMILYCTFSSDSTKISFRCFMGIISVICLFCCDFISTSLFMALNLYDFRNDFGQHLKMHINYEILILSISSIIMIILSIIVSMLHSKKRFTTIDFAFLFSTLIQFIFILFINTIISRYNITIDTPTMITFSIIIIVCMIFIALITKISNKIVDNKFDNQKKSFLEYYEKMYTDYHNKTEKNLMEIRKIKHDFNNSMQVVKSLINNNNLKDASSLVTQLEESYNNDSQIYCNNPILNVILQNANEYCLSNGIEFHTDCFIPEKLSINAVDICNISNNMLQNAFEAISNINSNDVSKNIYFSAWQDNNMIFIKTINSKGNSIKLKDKKILTSKIDTQNHGLGLDIIEHIAIAYDGNVIIDYDQNSFTVLVQLNINR